MSLLKVQNVTKTFIDTGHAVPALKDIELEVKQGEFLILLGPSGSGKSTLLRLMAGLIPTTHGKIVAEPGIAQSFIFQDFALFPWLSVEDNIGFGLKMNS